jgi:hypothetical protein
MEYESSYTHYVGMYIIVVPLYKVLNTKTTKVVDLAPVTKSSPRLLVLIISSKNETKEGRP